MVKKGGSKLFNALAAHKGVDPKLETQKRAQKKAEKRNRQKKQKAAEESEDEEEGGVGVNGVAQEGDEAAEVDAQVKKAKKDAKKNAKGSVPEDAAEVDGETWETDEDDEDDDEEDGAQIDLSALNDSESESESEIGDDDDDDDEDIPLSDIDSIASEDKEDVVPHQRLTINNTAALTAALHRITLPYSKLPFSDHQSVTTSAPTDIADTNDDLNRELAFYQQALASAKSARELIKKEGLPFTRPTDYFAEMVKSDEHMGKIKQKLVDEAASKRASQDARRQRDLKKFGKAVQVAKLQERDKAKRDTMEKINLLKRKRQGADLGDSRENGDMFDVALEDAAETERKDKAARKAGGGPTGKGSGSGRDNSNAPNAKRQKKDSKYGFGGKKRFGKSNDAESAGDVSGYSVKRMKGRAGGAGAGAGGKGGRGPAKRPGKDRRKAGGR